MDPTTAVKAKPSFVLAKHELRQVFPDAFNGMVTVNVAACTADEYEKLIAQPENPLSSTKKEWLEFVGSHVKSIEGLVVEGAGEIKTVEDALTHGPPWLARVLYSCVVVGSRLTSYELEKLKPQSSGAGSTAPGTADVVDADD
jgi:hypothetical protein